jgi:hypothetical protein
MRDASQRGMLFVDCNDTIVLCFSVFPFISLYSSCAWDDRTIRKLVGDGKLAARCAGTDDGRDDAECPICFLSYREINITTCCHAFICTECYLQVKPQLDSKSTKSGRGTGSSQNDTLSHSPCPFCNTSKLNVRVAKSVDMQSAAHEIQQNEQRLREAQKKVVPSGLESQDAGHDETIAEQARPPQAPLDQHSFGASLDQMMRSRANSTISATDTESDYNNQVSGHSSVTSTSLVGKGHLHPHVLTPQERKELEQEMKRQHQHPLSQRLQAEEDERRFQHEQDYYRNRIEQRRQQLQALSVRRALATSRSGGANRSTSTGSTNENTPFRGFRDWTQMVEAWERAELELGSVDDLDILEAAFMLGGRNDVENDEDSAGNHADEVSDASSPQRPGRQTPGPDFQAFVRAVLERRRREEAAGGARYQQHRLLPGSEYVMAGMSEEDQIAMAIAASLQDHQQEPADGGGTGENGHHTLERPAVLRVSETAVAEGPAAASHSDHETGGSISLASASESGDHFEPSLNRCLASEAAPGESADGIVQVLERTLDVGENNLALNEDGVRAALGKGGAHNEDSKPAAMLKQCSGTVVPVETDGTLKRASHSSVSDATPLSAFAADVSSGAVGHRNDIDRNALASKALTTGREEQTHSAPRSTVTHQDHEAAVSLDAAVRTMRTSEVAGKIALSESTSMSTSTDASSEVDVRSTAPVAELSKEGVFTI